MSIIGLWFLIGLLTDISPTPSTLFAVRVMVLDASEQPVSGLDLELLLIQYGETVELFWAGTCETDVSGACLIVATMSPSSPPDWYEGVIYVGDLGRQRVGWHGAEAFLLIELSTDGRVPTEEPVLHPPYEQQDEVGTELPSGNTPTVTVGPLNTPSPEATPTERPTLLPALALTTTPLPLEGVKGHDLGMLVLFSILFGSIFLGIWLYLRRKPK